MTMPTRYSTGAIILHWAIAIAVIVTWRIAESVEHATRAESEAIMANHVTQLAAHFLVDRDGVVRWTHL